MLSFLSHEILRDFDPLSKCKAFEEFDLHHFFITVERIELREIENFYALFHQNGTKLSQQFIWRGKCSKEKFQPLPIGPLLSTNFTLKVEYLIKTVYNWRRLCDWKTIFRSEFSNFVNAKRCSWVFWEWNIFPVCWILMKEIDESTIQRPRIWPAFLAFILFPPVGFVSFLLYKNAIDHIKYRRLRSKKSMVGGH